MAGKNRLEEADRVLFNAAEAKEQNLIGKKLLELRKAAHLSAEELSARLERYGVSVGRGAITKWELGLTAPGSYQLLALCDIYHIDDCFACFSGVQELNAAGLRKVAEYRQDLIASGRYARVREELRYVLRPVSLLAASAGTGNFLDEDNFEYLSFPESAVPAGADFALRITGDSMEPVYSGGQIVWVQKCSMLRKGEVGIFTYRGDGYIKSYSEQIPENPEDYLGSDGVVRPQPVLISFNPAYAPIQVNPEEPFQIIGRVL